MTTLPNNPYEQANLTGYGPGQSDERPRVKTRDIDRLETAVLNDISRVAEIIKTAAVESSRLRIALIDWNRMQLIMGRVIKGHATEAEIEEFKQRDRIADRMAETLNQLSMGCARALDIVAEARG